MAYKPKVVITTPIFNKDMAWMFFDGACKGEEGRCGGGMVLYLNENNYFLLKLGIGIGTNTRLELLSLCGILFFAYSKGISSL